MKKSNKIMIESALRIAKECHIKTLFVFLDALSDTDLPHLLVKGPQIFFVTQKNPEYIQGLINGNTEMTADSFIYLPQIEMTRLGRIKISMMLALSQHLVNSGDKVIFINGLPDTKYLNTIALIDTAKDVEIITTEGVENILDNVNPEVFQEMLAFAIELSSRGREGKPIGTIFVLGDEKKVLQLSKQMIINPFKGYSDEELNILNPQLKETLREFSALDGAFIISGNGKILTAGCYLSAAGNEEAIPRGLGARHMAAAGITSLTDAVAIVISESTGDVRIFKNGKIILQIESPETPLSETIKRTLGN